MEKILMFIDRQLEACENHPIAFSLLVWLAFFGIAVIAMVK